MATGNSYRTVSKFGWVVRMVTLEIQRAKNMQHCRLYMCDNGSLLTHKLMLDLRKNRLYSSRRLEMGSNDLDQGLNSLLIIKRPSHHDCFVAC
jgi:hypothetical protein